MPRPLFFLLLLGSALASPAAAALSKPAPCAHVGVQPAPQDADGPECRSLWVDTGLVPDTPIVKRGFFPSRGVSPHLAPDVRAHAAFRATWSGGCADAASDVWARENDLALLDDRAS